MGRGRLDVPDSGVQAARSQLRAAGFFRLDTGGLGQSRS